MDSSNNALRANDRKRKTNEERQMERKSKMRERDRYVMRVPEDGIGWEGGREGKW